MPEIAGIAADSVWPLSPSIGILHESAGLSPVSVLLTRIPVELLLNDWNSIRVRDAAAS